MNRRNFLMSSAAGAAFLLPMARAALASTADINDWFGAEGAAFSFERLTDLARQRAGREFVEPDTDLPERLAPLTYDQPRAIRYRPDHAVWHGKAPFELQAFHMGWLFKAPVAMFEVDGGKSKPLAFKPADFEYRAPLDPAGFADIQMPGVAGFRVHNALNRPDIMDELAVFLGASYFRALGRGNVYGLSARGLAVNTATQDGEEFPRFDAFFIETPSPDAEAVTIYASLDSRSVTGAYAFRIVPGEETTMEVTARIFLRADVERLGVAPMTSMFLFGENNRSAFRDYRNAVHDSDGLKIVRRGGEEVWRNLNNRRGSRRRSSTRKALAPSAYSSATAPSTIIRMPVPRMSGARLFWSSRSETGAGAPSRWSRYRPSSRSTTISSPSGSRRARSRPARISNIATS